MPNGIHGSDAHTPIIRSHSLVACTMFTLPTFRPRMMSRIRLGARIGPQGGLGVETREFGNELVPSASADLPSVAACLRNQNGFSSDVTLIPSPIRTIVAGFCADLPLAQSRSKFLVRAEFESPCLLTAPQLVMIHLPMRNRSAEVDLRFVAFDPLFELREPG